MARSHHETTPPNPPRQDLNIDEVQKNVEQMLNEIHEADEELTIRYKPRQFFSTSGAVPNQNDGATHFLDIETVRQLKYWVQHHLDDFLNVFNDLRIDRDKYLIALKNFHEFVKLFKTQKKNLFDIGNILEQIRDRLKTSEKEKKRVMSQLVDKRIEYDDLIKLNETRRSGRAFNFDSDEDSGNIGDGEKGSVVGGSIATSFIKFSKKKRTGKHPNPDKFTDDVNSDWLTWKINVHDKFTINSDWYETARFMVTTVIGWTEGEAAKHIQSRRYNNLDYFESEIMVINFLEDIYGDSDHQRNVRREYRDLTMFDIQDFQSFYSNFHRLGIQTNFDQLTLMEDLVDKLIMSLKQALNNSSRHHSTLLAWKNDIQQVYNGLVSIRKKKIRIRAQKPVLMLFKTTSAASTATPFVKSATSAPFVKPNGQLRLCVDYRRLNHITKRNRYPIPLIEETLARVQGCKYLIKLNIISAFNKLRMSEESEELITFVTSMKSYKYRVLPFGLINDPASWQHYMNDLLFNFLNEFCQVYLDDILIYSKFKKEHIVHVRAVLEKLKEVDLQVDIEKCEFFKKEVAFLGVILSVNGLRMDPKKIQVIVDWARFTNLKKVQVFVGFVNFYRRFIRDFSKKVRALTRMIKKLVGFEWITEAEEVFNLLKKTVIEAPIFRHYDRIKQAILEIDSSDYVNAGVLSQYDDEGVLHLVAFYSRNMISVECNYEIYDKELLVIIRCLEHWRSELEGTDEPIKIFTDHKGLETFMTSKKLTFRQARWAEILSEFNIAIQFQSGAQNVKADVLIRMPSSRPKDDSDERHQYREQVLLISERLEIHVVESDESIYERVLAANKADDDCRTYREAFSQGLTLVNGVNLRDCQEKNDALYYKNRLWVLVDAPLLVDLLREIHELPASGHFEFNRMKNLLRRDYYWFNMRKAVRRYVRNCHGCQRTKTFRNRKNGLLTFLVIPLQRWTDIFIDFITGLFDAHGHNAICTIIDRLSKERHYAFCTAEDEGTSAEITAKILIQYVFRTHDLFFFITFDRGFQFVSLVWQAFCRILGIKCKLFTAFHSEIDGQTERANQDIERQLRQYCNYMQNDWDVWLSMVEFADNNAVFASTELSPFFVNKGFHSRMSFSSDSISYVTTKKRLLAAKAKNITGIMQNILNYVRDHVDVAQKRMTIQVNKHRKVVKYVEGDYVFLNRRNIKTARSFDKLDDKKLGSFKVLERRGNFYQLELFETMRIYDVFHCWFFRKNFCDFFENQINESFDSVIVNENLEWEMNDILKSRYHYNRLQYRANWSGWPHDRTWYYVDNGEFDNARDVIEDFHRNHSIVAGSEPFKPNIFVVDTQDPLAGRRRSRRKVAVLALIEATFD